jgi:hypothetical protein
VLDRIAAWLGARRRDRGRLMTIETRFIAIESEAARKLPEGLHVIDQLQAKRLIELVRTRKDVSLITAPKITAFDGQRANVVIANQIAYIGRYEIRAKRGVVIGDPEVRTLSEGVALDIRATAEPDGWNRLELEIQRADLLRPIPELKTRFGTVQVPEVVHQRLRVRERIPAGGWALLAGLTEVDHKNGRPGRPILVLVRLTRTELSAVQPKKK